MDVEAILGHLPSPWKVRIHQDSNSIYVLEYFTAATSEISENDPSLSELPEEWERLPSNRTADDPIMFARFGNEKDRRAVN
jgi:hypothetical protein